MLYEQIGGNMITMNNGEDIVNLKDTATGKFTNIEINQEQGTVAVTVIGSDDLNSFGRRYVLEYDNAFSDFVSGGLEAQIRRLARQGYPEMEQLEV